MSKLFYQTFCRYQKIYDSYIKINSSNFEYEIDILIRRELNLKEYKIKISYLKDLHHKVCLLPNKVEMNLFVLDCSELNLSLITKTKTYTDKILGKIIQDNSNLNRMICNSFERMSAKVLKEATTPDECMELLQCIENYRNLECPKLKVLKITFKVDIL